MQFLIPDNTDEKDCAPCAFASCSHICVMKKPTVHSTAARHNFACECDAGYVLNHIGNSSYCKAKGNEIITEIDCCLRNFPLIVSRRISTDEPAYMIVASESELKKTNPQKPYGNETSHIFSSRDTTNEGKIESIDYIMEDGGVRIFWSSLTLKTIQTLFQRENSNSLNLLKGDRKKRASENAQNIVRLLN